MTFWSVLPEVTLKVSLVVLLALAVVWCLRCRSAAARHWVLSVAVGCAFAVPVLSALAPTWHVPVAQPWSVTVPTAVRLAGATDTLIESGEPSLSLNATLGDPAAGPDARHGRWPSTAALMLPIWIMGVAGLGALLLLGLARLAWLSAGATPVADPRWLEQAAQTGARLGIRQPVRLLQSDHPTLLATWGLLWPKVMVPAGALAWDDERIRVVLAHELAHIRRGDWAVQLGADVLRALFWFNPLMWVATRCLRRDSELACDDTVLGLGVDGADYATQLLDLAKALRSPASALSPGMAMARPSGLERRITAMMNPTLRRSPFLGRSRLAVLAAALAVTIPLAVLAQSGPGTVSGTVVDSAGQPWAGARVTLSPVGLDKEEMTLRAVHDRSAVLGEARTIVFRGHAEPGDADPQVKEWIQREFEDADRVVRVKREVAVRRSLGGDTDVALLHLDRARWSTRSDDVGRFEIADVPPGDYRLAVHLPGFASVEENVTVEAGQRLQREIALEVGSLEETYTVAASDPAPVPTSTSATTLEEQRQRIGDGPLQPPIKLRSLTPAYPDVLRASGAQGTVILEGLVAADGSFQVLNVLTPVDPDLLTPVQPAELARAAVDAARQWQFWPTRLHGLPVDTRMKVTVHFTDES